jgi:antitoxin component of MazEF toxin-antitoxin module
MASSEQIESFTEIVFDVENDTVIERDFTQQEVAELLAIRAEIAQELQESEAKVLARASALAKLADLGLTAEEIAAL